MSATGGTLPFLTPLSGSVAAGGSVSQALTPLIDELADNITIVAPDLEEAPETSLLNNRTVVEGLTARFGALLHWVDYFATDASYFANGIDYVQLFNDKGRVYRMGILAPKSALTASDTAVINLLYPSTNDGATVCGGLDFNCRHTALWYDSSGTYHTSPFDQCDNWQAVNDTSNDDVGNVEFSEANESSASCQLKRVNWKLTPPAYTPTVDSGHSIKFRVKYTNVGSPAHNNNFIVSLYQGSPYVGAGSYTVIKTQNYTNADFSTSYTDVTLNLASAETALITDYSNLYLIIEMNVSALGLLTDYRYFSVSRAYLELPTTGSDTLAPGVYSYVYTYVRSATGTESGPSPELQFNHVSNSCVTLDDIIVSTDPDVDYINIYRTPIGGGNYILIHTTTNTDLDATAGWFQDCVQDSALTGSNVILLDYKRKRTYRAGLPPKMRYLASYQNCIWGAGALNDAKYTAGFATFTYASDTVVGAGTVWTQRLEGRSINVLGAATVPGSVPLGPGGAVPPGIRRDPLDTVVYNQQTYRIITVTGTGGLVIDRPFEDAGGSYSYEIIDDRNPNILWRSAPGFPEDWPGNGIELESGVGAGVTGLLAYQGALYAWTEDNVYRVTGNGTNNFRVDLVFKGIGCSSGHTIVLDEESNLVYFKGKNGYYAFDGQSVQSRSSALVQGKAIGIDRDLDRVNLNRDSMCVSVYDADFNSVLNFVTLDEGHENENAFVMDVEAANWGIDDTLSVVSAARVYDENGDPVVLVGGIFGDVWLLNQGNCDGAYSGTIVAQCTSATQYQITCAGANFSTDLTTIPVFVVDGEGRPFRIRCNASTADTLVTYYPLPELPNENYTVVVGHIDFYGTTGFQNYGVPQEKTLDYLEVMYEPSEQGSLYFRSAVDNGELVYLQSDDGVLDLTRGLAIGKIVVNELGTHIQFGWRQFVPHFPIHLVRLDYYTNIQEEQT